MVIRRQYEVGSCLSSHCHPNLQLEIDDITFPEEVVWMPCKRHITEPCSLLLPSPTHYHTYLAFDDSLSDVGTTVKEVYMGLRDIEAFHLGMKESGWNEIDSSSPLESSTFPQSMIPAFWLTNLMLLAGFLFLR